MRNKPTGDDYGQKKGINFIIEKIRQSFFGKKRVSFDVSQKDLLGEINIDLDDLGDKRKSFDVSEEELGISKFTLPESFKITKQSNGNDCGPCSIINTLNAFGIENKLDINTIRSMCKKNNGEWLTVLDIHGILRLFNLNIYQHRFDKSEGEELKILMEDKKGVIIKIINNITVGGKEIIGQHYISILNGGNGNLIILDSKQDSSINISKEDFKKLIANSEYQISFK